MFQNQMFRGVYSFAVTYLLKQTSKTSAVNGYHNRLTRHSQGFLGHLAAHLRKETLRPRYSAEGISLKASDGAEAQHIDQPLRPQTWQQPFRQGDQKGFQDQSAGVFSPQVCWQSTSTDS